MMKEPIGEGPTPLASASSSCFALIIVSNSSYSPKVVCLQDDLLKTNLPS